MNWRSQSGQSGTMIGCGVAALAFIVVAGILFLTAHVQVNAGEVGVVSHWGAIDVHEQPYSPGWHWITPFSGVGVDIVSVVPQRHPFSEVSAATRENQNVYIDGGINYHITPGEAAGIQANGGIDAYVSRIFNPAFQDYIKTESVRYTSAPGQKDSILLNRDPLRQAVLDRLREKATNDPSVNYHITVDDIFLTDIHFDKSYNAAIEAAAVAQQQKAQAVIDASKAVVVAQGEADANHLKSSSITPELIQYFAIQIQQQAIAKWNGIMPQVTGGSTPFVNLGSAPK